MTLNDYQNETSRTSGGELSIGVCALGICGEGGEVADHVKKHLAQGHELDATRLAYELGDVLWYVAQAALAIGTTLEDVAMLNVEKLRLRYPNGFEVERSVNRNEGGGGIGRR